MPRPNIGALSLNLDGCRFGDSPRGGSGGGKRSHQSQRSSREENCHPNQQQQQNNQQLVSSPLSTHHHNHQPQYNNHHHANYHSNNNKHQQGQQQHLHPPSPLGTTYRFEGLSIGHNFLRFRGSTLSEQLSLDELDIRECLGRGVCSSVWKAGRKARDGGSNNTDAERSLGGIESQQQSPPTKYYALKLFPLRDPDRRTMLIRELKLLCSFSCECLVELEGAFLDSADDNDNNYSCGGNTVTLVLEYMDRGSLEGLTCGNRVNQCCSPSNVGFNIEQDVANDDLSSGRDTTTTTPEATSSPLTPSPPKSEGRTHGCHGQAVPEYAVAAIAYQILWGLSYLHYEGVLHRDIKPANVLVSSNGRVKLADFGIVSQHDNDDDDDANEGTIMNHTVVGTTRYMSPERLRGQPYKKSSDVWSVGLVLLEIVRGDSPFEDVSSVVELVQTLDECNMAEFIPEATSNGLREILLGCLDHCPQKRIPASILLSSPWFQFHEINDVDDASSLMMAYLDSA